VDSRAVITQAHAPLWAREAAWPHAPVIAARIAELPEHLRPHLTQRWEAACQRLGEEKAEVVREMTERGPIQLDPWGWPRGFRVATTNAVREFHHALDKVEQAAGELRRYGIGVTADYQERRAAARALARTASNLLGLPKPRTEWKAWSRLYGKGDLDPDSPADQLRAIDPKYWMRRMSKDGARAVEAMWMHAAPALVEYCSRDAAVRAAKAEEDQAEWAANTEIYCAPLDKVVPGRDLLNRSSRDKKRRAELLARNLGLCKLAKKSGRRKAYLITLTAPPYMHPTTTWDSERCEQGKQRRPNPRWDGSSAREVADWMQDRWAKARAAFKNVNKKKGEGANEQEKLMPYWILGAQPHKDATPHWHLVAWLRGKDEARQVEAILREKFDGTHHVAVDIRKLKGGSTAGVRYAARAVRYLSRSTAPEGNEASALKESEWARIVGKRRYRTSHSNATLWRLLRGSDIEITAPTSRPREDDLLGQAQAAAAQAQAAARRGAFAEFIRHARAAGLRLDYIATTTRYGEAARKVVGVATGEGDDEVGYIKNLEWVIRRKDGASTVMLKDQDKNARAREEGEITRLDNRVDAGELVGGAPPEWSGHGNNETKPTEQAARRAIFAAELEAEVAGWC